MTTEEPLTIFFIMYVVLIFTLGLVTMFDGPGGYFVTPKEIWEETDLNMVTCVILWLLWLVVNPIYITTRFLFFLAHFGRKEQKEDDERYDL